MSLGYLSVTCGSYLNVVAYQSKICGLLDQMGGRGGEMGEGPRDGLSKRRARRWGATTRQPVLFPHASWVGEEGTLSDH